MNNKVLVSALAVLLCVSPLSLTGAEAEGEEKGMDEVSQETEQETEEEKEDSKRFSKYFPPYKNIAGTGLNLSLRGAVEFEYDSNPYLYSRDAINDYDAYRDVSNPRGNRHTRFNGVESIDDWLTRVTMGLDLSKDFFKDRTTTFTFLTILDLYWHDTNKNHETYSFQLKQEITKDDLAWFRYSFIPEFVYRNLFDFDVHGYQRAFFSRQQFTAGYRHDFNQYLAGRFTYRLIGKNYNRNFNERDSTTNEFSFQVVLPRLLSWIDKNKMALSGVLFYELGRTDARGTDGDREVDFDISHSSNGFGGQVELELFKKFRIRPYYEFYYHEFTTGHSVDSDPLHAGRFDRLNTYGITTEYDVTRNVLVFFTWELQTADPFLKASEETNTSDEVLGYERNIFNFGLKFNF